MPGVVSAADDPRALAALIRSLQARVSRLETQNRLKDATLDAPGMLRLRDQQGTDRVRLGQATDGFLGLEGFEDDGSLRYRIGQHGNGGVGYLALDPNGLPLAAAEQAQGNNPVTVTSTSYTDAGSPLTVTASAGPSGQLLVVLSAQISAADPTITSSGFMSFLSTGGRTTAAQDVNSLQVSSAQVVTETQAAGAQGDHTHGQAGETAAGGEAAHVHTMYPAPGPTALRYQRHSRVVLLPGCDPRVPVQVTARYRVSSASGGYVFNNRSVVVVPL